jgi:hypothetical protein
MTKTIKISIFFLLASISTIFINQAVWGPFKISDYLLFVSFLFFIVAIFEKQIKIPIKKSHTVFVSIFFGAIFLGTISSLIIFKIVPRLDIIKGYCHIFANLVIFAEIIILSNYDKTLLKKILFSFLLSFIIIPFIYIRGLSKYFFYNNIRFEGILSDPNFFANFQIVPTLLILFFVIKQNTKTILRVLLFLLFCFSIGLILWSGSRDELLGLMASFVTLIFLLVPKITKKKLAVIVILILVSFPIGYSIIPNKSHKEIAVRINPTQTAGQTTNTQSTKFITNITTGQDRLNIWKNSLYFISKDPLGYGPGYNMIINIKGDGEEHRVSHNFELELLLTGGIFLFLLINYYLFKIIVKTAKKCSLEEFNEIHILFAVLIGMLVSSLFLDSFLFARWIWVIVALIVFYLEENPSDLKISD